MESQATETWWPSKVFFAKALANWECQLHCWWRRVGYLHLHLHLH